MTIFKNVYFHKLDVYKRLFLKHDQKADSMKKSYYTAEEIDTLFSDIIDNKLNNNCIRIDDGRRHNTLEIIKYEEDYIFAKIGKYQDRLTVQLRNTETLEPAEIERKVNQELEVFTYLLIDRKNYVISYLREQSAPFINTLQYLIDNNYKESRSLIGEISGVIIDDAIPLLKEKELLGTFTYRLTVPTEELIGLDGIGLSQEDYLELQNQKNAEIEIKLVAERNKSGFKSANAFERIIKKIMGRTEKASIRAKDDGGYMQEYNIINSQLTKRVKFTFDRESKEIQDEIYKNLKITYENNKHEVLEYISKE